MTLVSAYAAQHAGAPLAPFSFLRREPRAHDVAIEIAYCGICHTDIHFVNDDFGMSLYPLVPGMNCRHRDGSRVGGEGVQGRRSAAVGCLVDSCRAVPIMRRRTGQYCENGFVLTYSGVEKDGTTVTQGGYSKPSWWIERFVLRVSRLTALERISPLLCAGITDVLAR